MEEILYIMEDVLYGTFFFQTADQLALIEFYMFILLPCWYYFVLGLFFSNLLTTNTVNSQLTERAEAFCRALEGRWALGDCGNSVIVFVWEHYKKMIIWPSRLAEKYVTVEERKNILSKVNDLVQADKWYLALSQVIAELLRELNGEEQGKVDTGTLSLLVAVGLAVLLTMLITCCVCAFRCCGNLRATDRPRPVRRAVERVDSLREIVLKRGSQLRRSKTFEFTV
ncbi:hypothetical protein DICVIV_02451 [Dictyocaulus viviparus]|uniref:Uncharacterized protein n=1 Tax=Dictyocaulus viviparus TaxID=29172 RepID=A0A0D8Y3P9_DICVI|nr:hypothetical protein DICVIV_02451 [Dictyocaulus viviparus]